MIPSENGRDELVAGMRAMLDPYTPEMVAEMKRLGAFPSPKKTPAEMGLSLYVPEPAA